MSFFHYINPSNIINSLGHAENKLFSTVLIFLNTTTWVLGIVTDNGATRLDSYHGEPAIEVPFISILFLELIISDNPLSQLF